MSGMDKVFRNLHAGPDLLILPNAWDAGSARVVEAAGARAIATSSAAVAWSHGYADGQFVPFAKVVATIEEIARLVRVPVSADIESGYAATAAEIEEPIARVVSAGAVGVNLEDGTASPEILGAKIERAKLAARRAGIDLWVNARIDVYIRKLQEGEAAFAETIRRAALYKAAGADSVFVPALVDSATIGRMVPEVGLPFNALAWTGLPGAEQLKALGVRRLSAGGGLARMAFDRTYAAAQAFLRDGRVETPLTPAITVPNMNELMNRD
ncbi:MAG: isocitrate lyase/phosphoenolpyruvate mutase family protein [Alphaproteobacteria bacterium]|nr:isocitrate lyase/phosphoenolpyruvate mutase family protein [Alphaproteobacteria bacterium]